MDKRCQDPSEIKEWKAIWKKLIRMDEHELYEETRCMAKCQRKEWTISKIFDDKVEKKNKSMKAMYIFYTNGRYQVGRQYYTYDFNSYMSDFGGYLGLLLGYSIGSLFDMAQDLFTYLIKQQDNQVKVSSG